MQGDLSGKGASRNERQFPAHPGDGAASPGGGDDHMKEMVLLGRIELPTSALPRMRSPFPSVSANFPYPTAIPSPKPMFTFALSASFRGLALGLLSRYYPMMAVGRITKTSVEAIPKPLGKVRNYLWDDRLKGFGCMVMSSGTRSYLVQYKLGGRAAPTRRATIGKHGSPWTAENARARATDLLEMVRKGIDPVDEDRRQREAAASGKEDAKRLAFDSYAESFFKNYVDRGGKRGKGAGQAMRSADDIKAVFRRDLMPTFKAKPISTIRKADIVACLDLLVARSMSAAIKAHKWLRRMFAWAVERGDIAVSPMDTIPAPGVDGERERVLKGDELKAVWLGAGKMKEPYASFVQVLLLTGQRLREVAGMTWAEVDIEKAEWIIPGARTKNKRDHLVPLSPLVVATLTERFPDEKKRKGPVFTTDGTIPINGFSKPKAVLDGKVTDALKEIGGGALPLIEPWVFHDLRRSFSTGGQALGFPRDHMHAAVNHAAEGKRSGLARIYQLYEYREEKVAVMNAWARHLEALLNGDHESNVVPLASARGAS